MQYFSVILQVIILVAAAAVFSGLNISLMSLRVDDLKRKVKLGNVRAKRVLPLRQSAHLSLSAILFANVAVVSATSLVLEHHFNGLIAGVATTILMVVFGEVLPQALFVKRALFYSALFAPLIRLVTIVTFPVSKPLSMLLDRMLGTNEGLHLHTRAELGLIISDHKLYDDDSELDEDEVEIIQATLQLSTKTVKDIMSPMKSVYWLKHDAILNAKTVDEIKLRGYSRIPVLSKGMTQCYGVILMKDMVDINFDENPVPVMNFRLHPTKSVGSRTALDTMFHKLSKIKSHLIPVEQNGKIIGILTIEDLIEEIIGHEIEDETDHAMHRK